MFNYGRKSLPLAMRVGLKFEQEPMASPKHCQAGLVQGLVHSEFRHLQGDGLGLAQWA